MNINSAVVSGLNIVGIINEPAPDAARRVYSAILEVPGIFKTVKSRKDNTEAVEVLSFTLATVKDAVQAYSDLSEFCEGAKLASAASKMIGQPFMASLDKPYRDALTKLESFDAVDFLLKINEEMTMLEDKLDELAPTAGAPLPSLNAITKSALSRYKTQAEWLAFASSIVFPE